jgi:hypothetical protein
VSAFEKFLGFGGKNSQTSDLVVAIRNNLAKADPWHAFARGSNRPTTDPQVSNISSGFRHIPVIEPAKEVAGGRHAWRLKFGRFDRREGAILGVSAEISQAPDAPGSNGFANLFLYLVE